MNVGDRVKIVSQDWMVIWMRGMQGTITAINEEVFSVSVDGLEGDDMTFEADELEQIASVVE